MVFKKIIFQNRYVELETPPPFMEKNILNFHFDYLNTSLSPSDAQIWKCSCSNSGLLQLPPWDHFNRRLMQLYCYFVVKLLGSIMLQNKCACYCCESVDLGLLYAVLTALTWSQCIPFEAMSASIPCVDSIQWKCDCIDTVSLASYSAS